MNLINYILKVLEKLTNLKIIKTNAHCKDSLVTSSIIISEFSNEWNKYALSYSLNRRSLHGRLPVLGISDVDNISVSSANKSNKIELNISNSTNEWNRYALDFVNNKKSQNHLDQKSKRKK